MKDNEKSVVAGWFEYLFGYVTRSERAPEKNSCEKIFSLALTRREIEILSFYATCALTPGKENVDKTEWALAVRILKLYQKSEDDLTARLAAAMGKI